MSYALSTWHHNTESSGPLPSLFFQVLSSIQGSACIEESLAGLHYTYIFCNSLQIISWHNLMFSTLVLTCFQKNGWFLVTLCTPSTGVQGWYFQEHLPTIYLDLHFSFGSFVLFLIPKRVIFELAISCGDGAPCFLSMGLLK